MELPKTLQEAILFFADEEKAHDVLVQMRWPTGKVECPHCKSMRIGKMVFTLHKSRSQKPENEGKMLSRRVWNCKKCKKQFSAKVGTIFADSALGLDKWLPALWMLTNAKNGVSSYEIHRALHITQKSAWFVGHRLRLALKEGTFEMMKGIVEGDEAWLGGASKNMHGERRKRLMRGHNNLSQSIVQGLLERSQRKACSRVKLNIVPNTGSGTLQNNVRQYVLKGTHVFTDAYPAYRGLRRDFQHKFVDHAVQYVRGAVHTNGLENFWSLLKRMVKGTYICPSPVHLSRYLDEQSYRFNERKGKDADRFEKALAAIAGKRITYKELIGETP
jgi:transposase-like protein